MTLRIPQPKLVLYYWLMPGMPCVACRVIPKFRLCSACGSHDAVECTPRCAAGCRVRQAACVIAYLSLPLLTSRCLSCARCCTLHIVACSPAAATGDGGDASVCGDGDERARVGATLLRHNVGWEGRASRQALAKKEGMMLLDVARCLRTILT